MKKYKFAKALLLTLASVSVPAIAADALDSSVNAEKKMNRAAAKSQKKIDGYADSAQQMLAEYQHILQKIDQNKAYNRELELLIGHQNKDLASVEEQIDGIEDTEKGISPLMSEMILSLDQFVGLDIPFRVEERKKAIRDLQNLMIRADVTTSEKFRRILEAYKYEVTYGLELDSYQDEIEGVGTVEFFRMGRVAFIYRRLDGKEAYYWDTESKSWSKLPDSYLLAIRNGIRMEKNQAQLDLIKLPVKPAEKAQ